MTKKKRSPAAERARARQAAGDPRPYSMILDEEKVNEYKRTHTIRSRPIQRLEIPDVIFLEPDADTPPEGDE